MNKISYSSTAMTLARWSAYLVCISSTLSSLPHLALYPNCGQVTRDLLTGHVFNSDLVCPLCRVCLFSTVDPSHLSPLPFIIPPSSGFPTFFLETALHFRDGSWTPPKSWCSPRLRLWTPSPLTLQSPWEGSHPVP